MASLQAFPSSLLPPPSRVVSRPNSLPLPFQTPATQASIYVPTKTKLLVFLFAFFFPQPLIFTLLAANISHFPTAVIKFSCCSSNQIILL